MGIGKKKVVAPTRQERLDVAHSAIGSSLDMFHSAVDTMEANLAELVAVSMEMEEEARAILKAKTEVDFKVGEVGIVLSNFKSLLGK